MKKKILSLACAASLLSLGVQTASAESVAVDDSAIFILDNSVAGSQIVVKNLTDGTANACLSDASLDQLNLDTGTTATDILIKNSTAVVTTYNSTSLVTDVKLVNVASCLTGGTGTTGGTTTDLSECYATLDGDHLHIPCFLLDDEVISVELYQRGKSMNFEYESYKPKKDHDEDDD